MFERIVLWVLGLFGLSYEPAAPDEPSDDGDALKSPMRQTLAQLLHRLHGTYHFLRMADSKLSSVGPTGEMARAYRMIGPLIPYDRTFIDQEVGKDTTSFDDIPSMMCIAAEVNSPEPDDDDRFMRFFFAMRLGKKPFGAIYPIDCKHYLTMGICLQGKTNKKSLQWLSADVGLDCEGMIVFPLQKRQVEISLPKSKRIRGPQSFERPSRFEWHDPNIEESGLPGMTLRERYSQLLARCVTEYNTRHEQWNVVIKNEDGMRATFCIPVNKAKHFFKDREATETSTGRKKKIVHFVRSHTRTYASGKVINIEEHLRGESEFKWDQFSCKVIAPEFQMLANPDIEFDTCSDHEKETTYGASPVNLAHMMRELEDTQTIPKPRMTAPTKH